MVAKGKMDQEAGDQLVATTMGAITGFTSVDALKDCDLIIEVPQCYYTLHHCGFVRNAMCTSITPKIKRILHASIVGYC